MNSKDTAKLMADITTVIIEGLMLMLKLQAQTAGAPDIAAIKARLEELKASPLLKEKA